ncbi:MAG: ribulose-phosphate 3-epimerase [Bacillota bacterium]
MIRIAPSILSADFANLERDIKRVEEAGADMLHIDVMDGHFVPNITIGHPVVKSLRKKSGLLFDCHLMISNPENYIDSFADSGADIITVHAEASVHLHRLLQMIKSKGIKAGVALNPATPLSMIEHVLYDLDMLLIMSVNPGFGGQKFIPETFRKLALAKQMLDNAGLSVDIQVDGGVGLDNIAAAAKSGANIIVAGSAIFNSADIDFTINEMKRICGSI